MLGWIQAAMQQNTISFWEIEAKKNSFWDFMTFKNESIAFDSK